jgi:hypothetical protein
MISSGVISLSFSPLFLLYLPPPASVNDTKIMETKSKI